MFYRSFLSLLLSLIAATHLEAQLNSIVPSAPVKDFRFPQFGENGYTQWVLRGKEGIYDSAKQIRVEEMLLRLYTGDEPWIQLSRRIEENISVWPAIILDL